MRTRRVGLPAPSEARQAGLRQRIIPDKACCLPSRPSANGMSALARAEGLLGTPDGARAWDTFMTLAATTKKLDVSFCQYLHDRICPTNQIPPLANLVEQAAKELNLGWSWSTA